MDTQLELFTDAHAQLLARDQELLHLGRQLVDLLAANGAPPDGPGRVQLQPIRQEAIIRELQVALAEQTRWAQHAAEDVVLRDAMIVRLQASLAEQTAWAKKSAADVVERDEIILRLQASLAEQTAWARSSADEVIKRDKLIRDLQR